MNLQFPSVDNVVMKDENWCQTLGQYTGVHFPDLNPNSNSKNNIMKFGLHVSTKVKFNAIDKGQKIN